MTYLYIWYDPERSVECVFDAKGKYIAGWNDAFAFWADDYFAPLMQHLGCRMIRIKEKDITDHMREQIPDCSRAHRIKRGTHCEPSI